MSDARDAQYGPATPIKSLYGDRFEALSPAPEDLDGVDRLVIDLQDVGARYYTFVWTAVLALRAAAKRGIRVLVLDGPNPLGGDPRSLEGKNQADTYRSFVGLEPVPIRHGLSLGEIVAWRAHVEGVPRELLEVLRVKDLDPSAHAPAWDRPFVMPSPNMPSYETALVYPGGCLLEGTNLSDGRGTTRPFEITGAPWVDGVALARDFNAAGVAGARARALTFQPTFHKHARQVCGGVQIHVTDPVAFRPVRRVRAAHRARAPAGHDALPLPDGAVRVRRRHPGVRPPHRERERPRGDPRGSPPGGRGRGDSPTRARARYPDGAGRERGRGEVRHLSPRSRLESRALPE